MIAGIILIVLALACLIYACFAYARKGPLLSTMYLIATPAEKQKMKNQTEYQFVATTFLLLAAVLFIFGMYSLLSIDWIKSVAIAAIGVTILYAIVGSIISEHKHRK